jgi:hypothetical protein
VASGGSEEKKAILPETAGGCRGVKKVKTRVLVGMWGLQSAERRMQNAALGIDGAMPSRLPKGRGGQQISERRRFFVFDGGSGHIFSFGGYDPQGRNTRSLYSTDVQEGDFPAWRRNFVGKSFGEGEEVARNKRFF